MADYDNTNRGSIWKNPKKDEKIPDYKETLPDFTGSLNVEGVEYFFDAWKRKPNANPKAPALSFKIKRKEQQKSISERAMPKRRDPISSGKVNIIPDDDDMNGDRIPF